jgi:hypothetical protein
VDDNENLPASQQAADIAHWENWLRLADRLAAEILARRKGRMIDVDALLALDRADLEARDDWIIHRG